MNLLGWQLLAAQTTRSSFEWGRIQAPGDWLLPLGAVAAILLYVRWMYRRDSVELSAPVSWLLTSLRAAAFLALLVVYLQPQWRTERMQAQNSRAALLVDTSLSMALDDEETIGPATAGRLQPLLGAIQGADWVDTLRRRHDVVVARFDERLQRIAVLDKRDASQTDDTAQSPTDTLDWDEQLRPQGTETRLGSALRAMIYDERSLPLSAVVLISDGGFNAGSDPQAAIELATAAEVPVHVIGLGSDEQIVNVRVADLLAPPRAQPGDDFTITAYIQAQGLAGRTVTVDLIGKPSGGQPDTTAEEQEGSTELTLGADGEVVPVEFNVTPAEAGRRTYATRIRAPAGDRQPADNTQEVDVEIVNRKLRVLLFAGGPTREYQFLRNQLYRDETAEVDVLLQSSQPGISQEANNILDEMPRVPEALFDYDCILAFDPAWQTLDAEQLELIDRWIGEQAGGLIVLAGPVHTQSWAQLDATSAVRDWYPVEFEQRLSLLDEGRFDSREPWPLDFTRQGREAEFLWLEDNAAESARAWNTFSGVFGYFDVRGAKPAATVYATYSDPRAASSGDAPVYLAGHFYGAGRVMYLGSGEMWRLREVDSAYFERLYTKLLRHVSQGRLLRGSTRGTLLVENDRYVVGQTVVVRAQLSDAQREPLEVPTVPLMVFAPDGTTESITLTADASRAGSYAGQFAARDEGSYRLELLLPEGEDEMLTRRIQVRVPDIEREDPRRNDTLLASIASATGGNYYIGMEAALGADGTEPLAEVLRDRTRTEVIREAPIPLWNNSWMLIGICGLLCLEWFTRRLVHLA